MTAKIKKILIVSLLIFWVVYAFAISTPDYSGKTVINLDNRSFKSVSDAYISFDGTDTIVSIPRLGPMERIILIMPEDILNEMGKTTAYINYSGTSTILTEEYNLSINDEASYTETAIFEKKFVRSGNSYSYWEFFKELPISFIERLKPYTRIIDMNKTQ